MIVYRYSGGRFPQSAGEAAETVTVNAPLSVVLYSVGCALLLFVVLTVAAADHMSQWGHGFEHPALFGVVMTGAVLPVVAGYAVASNRKTGRLFAFLQLASAGVLSGLLLDKDFDFSAWHLLVQLLAVTMPLVAAFWLWGPTRARRYFDVIAGHQPHLSLLGMPEPTPRLDAFYKWGNVVLEWMWIALALSIFVYGAFQMYLN